MNKDQCFIIEFQNPMIFFIQNYIICEKDRNLGIKLRKTFKISYSKQISLINPNDYDFFKFLPDISEDSSELLYVNNFDFIIIITYNFLFYFNKFRFFYLDFLFKV